MVDANVLRNDIRRACRTGQRIVLVTAANAGLLRLFCAEHVYREVIEHSGDWTATGPVTREDFLRTSRYSSAPAAEKSSLAMRAAKVRSTPAR